MTEALIALGLILALPDLAGDSVCPSVGEVRDRLSVLASAREGKGEPARHRAYLSSTNQSVHIELLDADGGLLAERSLDKSGTCEDVALAVAVVLATWEGKLDPVVPAGAAPLAAAPTTEPDPVVARRSAAPPPPSLRFDAGLGLLGSLAGSTPAYGATLLGYLFPTRSSLGIRAALTAISTRSQEITAPASSAEWMRATLALGPDYRFGRSAPGLDLHASAVLALLHTQGAGLPKTASDTSLQLGLVAGLRGLLLWNNAAAWLGADVFVYPGPDRLLIGNYGDVGGLPRVEIALSLGISLGQFH